MRFTSSSVSDWLNGEARARGETERIASRSGMRRAFINRLMAPDWHKIEPLLGKFADDGLEHVGNSLAVFVDRFVNGHIDRRVGVAAIASRLELKHKGGDYGRAAVLPDAGGSSREERRPFKEPDLYTAVQVGAIDQHRDKLAAPEGLDDFDKGKFVRTDRDRFDAEALPVLLPPGVELRSGFFQCDYIHGEPVGGKRHSSQFPGAEVAGDKERAPSVTTRRLEEPETTALKHQSFKPFRAVRGAIT